MINNPIRDFSGCPVVRTPHSHCLGPGSIPGQGTRIPQAMQLSQKQINSSKSHKKSRVWGRDSFKKKKKKNRLILAEKKVKVTHSCQTLCDPMDYIAHGILQARILKWVAVPFSRGSSQPRDRTQVFHIAGGFFSSWATREAQEY